MTSVSTSITTGVRLLIQNAPTTWPPAGGYLYSAEVVRRLVRRSADKIKRQTVEHEMQRVIQQTMLITHQQWALTNQLITDLNHTHTHLTALFPRLPGWAGTRKVKPKVDRTRDSCLRLTGSARRTATAINVVSAYTLHYRHAFNGPFWILLKQETVSGSGISWAICKSAPRCRHIKMPAPHHSVFHRSDALPPTQPTASKHWLS